MDLEVQLVDLDLRSRSLGYYQRWRRPYQSVSKALGL